MTTSVNGEGEEKVRRRKGGGDFERDRESSMGEGQSINGMVTKPHFTCARFNTIVPNRWMTEGLLKWSYSQQMRPILEWLLEAISSFMKEGKYGSTALFHSNNLQECYSNLLPSSLRSALCKKDEAKVNRPFKSFILRTRHRSDVCQFVMRSSTTEYDCWNCEGESVKPPLSIL